MGQGLTIKCKSCGTQENYFLGVGMMYFPLENVLDSVIPKRRREKVREVLRLAGEDSSEYSHELYACPKCETLHCRFYLKISKDEKILFETKFRCGKCRNALIAVSNEDVSRYRCSDCGKKTISSFVGLMWD